MTIRIMLVQVWSSLLFLAVLPDSDALVEFGTKLGAGLVVMGAFARSRIREMFSGTLTRALVAGSPTPIYLQH